MFVDAFPNVISENLLFSRCLKSVFRFASGLMSSIRHSKVDASSIVSIMALYTSVMWK